MGKIELKSDDMGTKVKEAIVSSKTASTACAEMKKTVEAHEKKLANLSRS
jgi:hypothetical protein